MLFKAIIAVTLAGLAAYVAPCFFGGGGGCDASACSTEIRGQYVEGRTLNIFAGACHIGGEYDTRGREAVLAWRVDEGSRDGVDLAGLSVVAVVAGEYNLAAELTERRSVLYVSDTASAEQRAALYAWVEAEHAGVLGAVVVREAAPIAFERSCSDFSVTVGERVALSGKTLPDRECCKMPLNVWYEPFADVDDRLVASADFTCDSDELERSWRSSGENCAFVATF